MSRIRPEPGLVVKYQAVFSHHADANRLEGDEHPCVLLRVKEPSPQGDQRVLLAPISHAEPRDAERAIPIPAKAAAYVGLDNRPMWIKLAELNALTWPKSELPVGLVQVRPGEWQYPQFMPDRILNAALQESQTVIDQRVARVMDREKLLERYQRQDQFKQSGPALEHQHDQADD